jgi:hypothetical protein
MSDNRLSEEYCPHCDEHFEVDPEKCEPCPGDCGHKLYPCNQCPASLSECTSCDWKDGEDCYRFRIESEANGE